MPAELCPLSLGWEPSHLISVVFTLVFKGLRIPKDPRPPTRVSKSLARCLKMKLVNLHLSSTCLALQMNFLMQV